METEEKTQETTGVVAEESAQVEPEKSQREIELEQKLADKEKEAKAHQTTATKKSEEARRWQQKAAENEALNIKVDILAEMVEERFSEPTEEYGELKRKSTYQERLQSKTKSQPDPKIEEAKAHRTSVAQEIYALTDDKGKPFDKTPEFDRAYTRFMFGDADNALEIVKEITEKMTTEPKESEEARIDRKVNERLKQIEKDKGTLISETGLPSNAAMSDKEAEKAYIESKIPFEELPASVRKKYR